MDPLITFLKNDTLLENKAMAKKIRYRLAWYFILNNVLYRQRYLILYLKCVTKTTRDYILWEIHEGVCGNHLGVQSLAHKAIQQGYY